MKTATWPGLTISRAPCLISFWCLSNFHMICLLSSSRHSTTSIYWFELINLPTSDPPVCHTIFISFSILYPNPDSFSRPFTYVTQIPSDCQTTYGMTTYKPQQNNRLYFSHFVLYFCIARIYSIHVPVSWRNASAQVMKSHALSLLFSGLFLWIMVK